MRDPQDKGKRWNLFARELDLILSAHGCRLGHLDDRARIHPEKVRRLQRSLLEPRFHVVSPEEVDRIATAFALNGDEQLRLRAAILATAVEEMLMDRIGADDALLAADQILPIIEQALRLHAGERYGMGVAKDGMGQHSEGGSNGTSIESVVNLIERGTLDLHLSATAFTAERGTEHAREASAHFSAALERLAVLAPTWGDSEEWRAWYSTAEDGAVSAESQLHTLPVQLSAKPRQ